MTEFYRGPLVGSDYPYTKPLGSEVEYGLLVPSKYAQFFARSSMDWRMAVSVFVSVNSEQSFAEQLHMVQGGNMRQRMVNGARYYSDIGHPEYATPTVERFDDLVHAEIAGALIVSQSVAKVHEKYFAPYIHGELPGDMGVVRNNIGVGDDGKDTSFGYHLNVMTHREEEGQTYDWDPMLAFLVSSPLLFGAGEVEPSRDKAYTFRMAAKLPKHPEVANYYFDERTRGIISLRDEPHASVLYRRLHVTPLDTGMAPGAIWLKSAAVAMVSLIGEAGLSAKAEGLVPVDPVEAGRTFSYDVGMDARVMIRSGREMTQLMIQKELHALVGEVLSGQDRVDEQYKKAHALWGSLIDELQALAPRVQANREESLMDAMLPYRNIIDWANTLHLVRERGGSSYADAKRMTIVDKFLPMTLKKERGRVYATNEDIIRRFRARQSHADQAHQSPIQIDSERIAHMMHEPTTERAIGMYALVKKLVQKGAVDIAMNWDTVRYRMPSRTYVACRFYDPRRRTYEVTVGADRVDGLDADDSDEVDGVVVG